MTLPLKNHRRKTSSLALNANTQWSPVVINASMTMIVVMAHDDFERLSRPWQKSDSVWFFFTDVRDWTHTSCTVEHWPHTHTCQKRATTIRQVTYFNVVLPSHFLCWLFTSITTSTREEAEEVNTLMIQSEWTHRARQRNRLPANDKCDQWSDLQRQINWSYCSIAMLSFFTCLIVCSLSIPLWHSLR